ncbi:MAG: response regulator transcription factor [Phaeodactylibacter sp.]|nr:response regulator transcription factor [Phaeodactylibacter sp.]
MKAKKLLYVEDELALANIVKDTLELRGYEVLLVSDGSAVLDALANFQPDLCILDIMLPNVDGYTLGKQIQQQLPELPILFLSAKNQVADVVRGFKSGGSDYMRKPFSMEELMVRIENLLQLKGQAKPATAPVEKHLIHFGNYEFLPNKLLLRLGVEERKLTYREAEILKFLAIHKNSIIYKKELLLRIWGDDSLYNSRNLDLYIAKVREFFAEDPGIELITLRGVGYQFNVEVG